MPCFPRVAALAPALSLLALSLFACKKRPPAIDDAAADHGHDHEVGSSQLTICDERFELFIEHRVPVMGEPVRFAVHVTELPAGEPRRAGAVTLRFTATSGAKLEANAPAPASPGIYVPELVFPTAGAWKWVVALAGDGGEHAVALPDLVVHATEEEAAHAELPEPPEGISFLKEQQWKLRTRIEPVARQRLVAEIRVSALVSAPPSSRAKVSPPLAGRLLLPAGASWPALGERVERDAVLAWVEPPLSEAVVSIAKAEAEVAEAQVALDQSDAALRRVRALVEQKARTPRELEEAEFAHRSARARLDAALAVKESWRRTGWTPAEGSLLPRLALVAPIGGIVTRVGAVPGEFVGTEQEVFALLDPSVLHVEARVPEVDLPRLGESIEAAYSIPGSDSPPIAITGAGGGRLAWRDVEIDAATRTLTLHFELPDPGRRLCLGQSLVAHLTTAAVTDAIALPESAIVDEDSRPVAFVQLAGETFAKRDLVLGIRDRGLVEVREGLEPGERVVVNGAYAVRLASVSTTIPAHGHAH